VLGRAPLLDFFHEFEVFRFELLVVFDIFPEIRVRSANL